MGTKCTDSDWEKLNQQIFSKQDVFSCFPCWISFFSTSVEKLPGWVDRHCRSKIVDSWLVATVSYSFLEQIDLLTDFQFFFFFQTGAFNFYEADTSTNGWVGLSGKQLTKELN
jgi:hypothetical protein